MDVCLADACEMAGRELTVNQVMTEIEKDMVFYDESFGGVTFSGGEPLAQPDFLFALLKACRDRQIHTALDTSGFSTWQVLDRIRHHVDVFLFDLKLMNDEKHRMFTGVSNRTILENLLALSLGGHRICIRFPVIPGITDDEDNVSAIGVFAAGLPSMPQIDLLPYHHSAAAKYERLGKSYRLQDTRPPAEDSMIRLAGLLQKAGPDCKCGRLIYYDDFRKRFTAPGTEPEHKTGSVTGTGRVDDRILPQGFRARIRACPAGACVSIPDGAQSRLHH